MDQGFASMTAVKAVPKHLPPQSPVVAARGALRTPHAATGQDKALAVAQGVRTTANMPFMAMMLAIPMSAIGWIAGKAKRNRTQVVMSGGGSALMDGMRQTPLNKSLHTPATMVDMIADKAAEVGGRAQGWEAPLRARSASLRAGADKLGASLSKAFAPIGAFLGSGLEKMNLKEPVTRALRYVGNKPVGAGVAAVAATAGITAIWLTRSKMSREHAATQAEMRATFGENSPIVAEAAKIYSKDKSRSIVGSALECANEVLFVGFEAMPAAGGQVFMGMMAGQMGLSSAQQMFVTENPVADAFAGLKRAQSGEIKVPREQKAFWFQVLVGSTAEAKAKGGSRNHLAAAMGKELASTGTTIEQFAALVNDPVRFTAFTASVSEKYEAAKAAKASPDTHASAAKPAAAQPTMLAAAPAAQVTSVAHKGHVHAQQLASVRS